MVTARQKQGVGGLQLILVAHWYNCSSETLLEIILTQWNLTIQGGVVTPENFEKPEVTIWPGNEFQVFRVRKEVQEPARANNTLE